MKNVCFRAFMMLSVAFFAPIINAATFKITNFSGRDVFVKPFWVSKNPPSYIKLPHSRQMSYNSGLNKVEKIEWFTDNPGQPSLVHYAVAGQSDTLLSPLKVSKEFRIYKDGQYDSNFGEATQTQGRIAQGPSSFMGFVGNQQIRDNNHPFLIVENVTHGVILVLPPLKGALGNADRSFSSGSYDCIEPFGARLYAIGSFDPNSSSHVSAAADSIKIIKMVDQTTGPWYQRSYPIERLYSPSASAVPGKIQVFPGDAITYKLLADANKKSNRLFTIQPSAPATFVQSVGCSLKK